jgi:hypothetical protein
VADNFKVVRKAALYRPGANLYDGSNDYVTDSTIAGVANSKIITMSFWARRTDTGPDTVFATGIVGSANRCILTFDSDNTFNIILRNSGTTTRLDTNTTTAISDQKWHYFHIGVNLGTTTVVVYIDGSQETMVDTVAAFDDTIDWAAESWRIGILVSSAVQHFKGDLANIYINTTTYIDFTSQANRELFVDSDGNPMYLGDDGKLPTDSQPQLYSPRANPASDSKGTTVNWTTTGSLDARSGPARFYTTDDATFYDNTFRTVNTALTNVADSKVLTLAFAFRQTAGAGTLRYIWYGDENGSTTSIQVYLFTDDKLYFVFRNSSSVKLIEINTNATFTDTNWHTVIFAMDLGATTYKLYIDGASAAVTEGTGATDGTVNWKCAQWNIASDFAGNNKWRGDLHSLYINTDAYIGDLDTEANRTVFFTQSNTPVDMGSDGSTPTGVQPPVYAPNGNAAANDGDAGNFTVGAGSAKTVDGPHIDVQEFESASWGRTPIAAMFFSDSNTPTTAVGDGDADHAMFVRGFSDGTRDRAYANTDKHSTGGNTSSYRWVKSNRAIVIGSTSTVTAEDIEAKAAGDGTGVNPGPASDKWRVWWNVTSTSPRYITCVLIGGNGWQAHANHFTLADTSETNITDASFTPNFIIGHTAQIDIDTESVFYVNSTGLAVRNGENYDQNVLTKLSRHNVATSGTGLAVTNDKFSHAMTGALGKSTHVSITATHASGFTAQASAGMSSDTIIYLAVNTNDQRCALAQVSGPADAVSDWTISSLEFEPNFIYGLSTILASGATAIGTQAALTIDTGAASGYSGTLLYTADSSITVADTSQDGLASNSNTESTHFASPLEIKTHDGTHDNECSKDSAVTLQNGGWTLGSGSISTVTSASRQLFVLAVEEQGHAEQVARKVSGRSTARGRGRGIGSDRGYRFRRIRR